MSLGKAQPCDVRKEKEETTSSVPSACVLEGDVKGGHRPVTRSMSGGKTELHPRCVCVCVYTADGYHLEVTNH